MKTISKLWQSLALMAILIAAPSAGHAQVNFDVRGGAAIPAGDLADLAEVGGNAGFGIGYQVHPRVNLRVAGDVDILTGSDDFIGAPDLRLWHYNAGADIALLNPATTRLSLVTNVGAGATTIDTDVFQGAGNGLTETYFSLNAGLRLGYDLSRHVNVFVGGQAYVTFVDEEDLRPLTALSPDLAGQEIDALWSIPIQAGIRINLPNNRSRASASR